MKEAWTPILMEYQSSKLSPFSLFYGNDENPTGLEVIRDPEKDAAQVRGLCPSSLLHLLLTTTYTWSEPSIAFTLLLDRKQNLVIVIELMCLLRTFSSRDERESLCCMSRNEEIEATTKAIRATLSPAASLLFFTNMGMVGWRLRTARVRLWIMSFL